MKNDYTRRHVSLFWPSELKNGEIIPLKIDTPLDFIQYFFLMDDADPLQELYSNPLFVYALVPAEHVFKTYDEQISYLNQIGNHILNRMRDFRGIVFQASARICGIFSVDSDETEKKLHNVITEATVACAREMDCLVHGISSGPWPVGTEMGRIYYFMDEIWNFFHFLNEKPVIYHLSVKRPLPEGYKSWSECWDAYHNKMISSIREKQLDELLITGDRIISRIILWGTPSIPQIMLRVNQIIGVLVTDLIRKNLLGSRSSDTDMVRYDSEIFKVDREQDLRNLIKKDLERLYDQCMHYEIQKNEQIIQDIKQFIEKNLSDYNLSISTISKHFHMPSEMLSTKFRAGSSTSLPEYIHIRRVTRIKDMLISTDMTVDQIMQAAGYFSRSTMYRAFTRLTGMNPKDYRTAYQNNHIF